MTKDYYKFIKALRLKNNLSQIEVAEKIGVSRSTYLAFEKDGKIELSYSEASRLADLFGLSLEEMKSGLQPKYAKYKQMILAYLRIGGAKIPKTKLAKLLYLADFAWFYKHLESMSGMSYRKIQYGPVPDNYFRAVEELFEDGFIEIDKTSQDGAFLISLSRSSEREKLSELSSAEKKLITDIADKWKNKRTPDIDRFTHNQLPYQICRDNEIIPYELITQENPGQVY